MSQKLDVRIVKADGSVVILTKQASDNPRLWTRIKAAAQTARSIDIERHANPGPPPPHGQQHPLGSRCVYFSAVSELGITRLCQLGRAHRGIYTALFSADLNESPPGGDYYVSGTQLAMLEEAGVIVASWSDCSATPYSAAEAMATTRGLAYAGGQAENPDQYVQATHGGARHIIGEPSVLKQDPDVLKDAIRRSYDGSLAFIGEVMRPDPTYSAQGVNITSACFYIDRDAKEGGYIPLSAYSVMQKSLRDGCSIYTGGRMEPEDWDTYAAWTRPDA